MTALPAQPGSPYITILNFYQHSARLTASNNRMRNKCRLEARSNQKKRRGSTKPPAPNNIATFPHAAPLHLNPTIIWASLGIPVQDRMAGPLDCVCFTFIIDDIVLPDGTTCMAQLGGGGSQSLFGFQLVHSTLHQGQMARLALAAGVGADVPPSCVAWLNKVGVDTRGLVLHDRPTPRAWQVFEADGRRTQVWRGAGDPCDELYAMLRPRIDNLPADYMTSVNYHIGIHPLYPPITLLRALRAAAHASGGVLSVEPYTAAERAPTPEEIKVQCNIHLVQAVVSECDIFSPNLSEAESLVGKGDPSQLADRLLEAAGPEGARLVVIRCAEQGVYAQLGKAGPACQVPAVAESKVVDVTGAGNSFCGGFLAAFNSSPAALELRAAMKGLNAKVAVSSASGDAISQGLAHAAAWGCAAASLMIEEPGVPQTPLPDLQPRAHERYKGLLPRVQYKPANSAVPNLMYSGSRVSHVAGCCQHDGGEQVVGSKRLGAMIHHRVRCASAAMVPRTVRLGHRGAPAGRLLRAHPLAAWV